MPIKIHHGPPGSYKTAGAVNDDFIPAAKAGRVVVTNVRGLTRESVMATLDDVPETFDVINIDTSVKEGRDRLATWFHWVPIGAFLIIDEAQSIFPKHWTAADLRGLDYPGGFEEAWKAKRPANWNDAWDMHRHYNWDVVLTTPKITKIRDDIRGAAEVAYKHKNLATVSFLLKGRYLEVTHAAEDNGTSARDFLSDPVKRKVDPVVWSLYSSTATGVHSDSKFGSELLKNPRVLLLLGVLAMALYYVGRTPLPAVLGGKSTASAAAPVGAPAAAVAPAASAAPSAPGGPHPVHARADADPLPGLKSGPLTGIALYVRGSLAREPSSLVYMFDAVGDGVRFNITSRELVKAGYQIAPVAPCVVVVAYAGQAYTAFCGRPDEGAPGSMPAPPVAAPVQPSVASPGTPPAQLMKFS